ncbi:hypothetical protein Tdes44962_MAKER01426 [Teratosphaeria destructans]|uniref:Uncharacterized protein n=1 Tax=Teratosphaeria destructans TaxID=418781 RepID=A0A9W7SZD6_9PEZI|nr:hypothetical protein Tdes44962_MAKER01426 [Teratosphaeria destructans]
MSSTNNLAKNLILAIAIPVIVGMVLGISITVGCCLWKRRKGKAEQHCEASIPTIRKVTPSTSTDHLAMEAAFLGSERMNGRYFESGLTVPLPVKYASRRVGGRFGVAETPGLGAPDGGRVSPFQMHPPTRREEG